MNRTILFIAILIFVSLLGIGMVWYVYTDPTAIHFYTRPIPITGNNDNEFPKPKYPSPMIPPRASTTTPIQAPAVPVDTRSWGERLRDPAVPDVSGGAWQIYRNKKYGFEMKYPMKWKINTGRKNPDAVDSIDFYSKDDSPYPPIFSLDTFRATLNEFTSKNSIYNERFKHQGIIPDATINGIDLFILGDDASSNGNVLWMFFEKNSYIYSFGESFEGQSEDVNKIIEHMVKSFHFLK